MPREPRQRCLRSGKPPRRCRDGAAACAEPPRDEGVWRHPGRAEPLGERGGCWWGSPKGRDGRCCAPPAPVGGLQGGGEPPAPLCQPSRCRGSVGWDVPPAGIGAFRSPGARRGVHCPPPPPACRGAGSGVTAWAQPRAQRAELARPGASQPLPTLVPPRVVRLHPDPLTPKIGRSGVRRSALAARALPLRARSQRAESAAGRRAFPVQSLSHSYSPGLQPKEKRPQCG